MGRAQETGPGTARGTARRSAGLDVARGAAVLGTLATNVWVFTHPDGLLGSVLAPQAVGPVDALAQVLPLGVSLALLSLLFGVGLELQHRSARSRGLPWGRLHRVRALVLLVESGLHFLLLAEFDVLAGYAVAALLAGPVLAWSDRARRRVVLVLLVLHAAGLAVLAALLTRVPAGPAAALDTPYADGGLGDLVVFRLQHVVLFRAEPVGLLALSTASFLLGAGLVRAGLLEPGRGRRLRSSMVRLGVLGVAVQLVLLATAGDPAVLLTRYGTAVLVGLGVLGLVLTVQLRRAADGSGPRWAGRRLAEVGRAALSCYVLQNLVAGALCHGWGLGLAHRVPADDRPALTAVVFAVVSVVVVAAAHALARSGRRGPLEAVGARVRQLALPHPDRRPHRDYAGSTER